MTSLFRDKGHILRRTIELRGPGFENAESRREEKGTSILYRWVERREMEEKELAKGLLRGIENLRIFIR